MARITVEDCLPFVENRFELVVTASRRARQIARGAQALVSEDGDKPTVVALREIAAGMMNVEILDELDAKQRAAEEFELAAEFLAQEPTPPAGPPPLAWLQRARRAPMLPASCCPRGLAPSSEQAPAAKPHPRLAAADLPLPPPPLPRLAAGALSPACAAGLGRCLGGKP